MYYVIIVYSMCTPQQFPSVDAITTNFTLVNHFIMLSFVVFHTISSCIYFYVLFINRGNTEVQT